MTNLMSLDQIKDYLDEHFGQPVPIDKIALAMTVGEVQPDSVENGVHQWRDSRKGEVLDNLKHVWRPYPRPELL